MIEQSSEFFRVRDELVESVRFLNAKGWTPATSSNFSARIPGQDEVVAISRSGVDKAAFTSTDVILVDGEGRVVWPEGAKASAETLIHLAVYELYRPGAVLHTHSVHGTAYSLLHVPEGLGCFSGLELLKGLAGVTTHETTVEVPIFPNDQDMLRLAGLITRELTRNPVQGFLIEGHGLYTWGATVAEARRHVEVFEFLFEHALLMEGQRGSHHRP
jgi:methylthioribulose-1-phosphate dehydratase